MTVRPVLVDGLRVTLPAKLNLLLTVRKIVVPVAPELKLTGVVAEMVKSPTWTTETRVWEEVPGEPLAVMETE